MEHACLGAGGSRFDPTHPTEEMVVEGWSPYPSDKRIALSSILRATTEQQKLKENTMQLLSRLKRIAITIHEVVVVAVAQRTFYPQSVGSNPTASLVRRAARWSEQRPYKTKVEGSIHSTPT